MLQDQQYAGKSIWGWQEGAVQQRSGSEFVMIFPTALAAIPLLKNILSTSDE